MIKKNNIDFNIFQTINSSDKLTHFINLMKKCEHDSKYHLEGSVYIHTEMVLNELKHTISNVILTDSDKNILILAALFHDIGKPFKKKFENGEFHFYGHARTSYKIANELLDEFELTLYEKLQILNLILYHGVPNFFIMDKLNNEEKEIIKVSQDANIKLLCLLVEADCKGRITSLNDKDDLLISLEYFKEYAIKLNCYDNPFIFNSNFDKFNFLNRDNYHQSAKSFNDTKSHVIMLSGLCGVGKDYYIKNTLLKQYKDYNIISLDEIRTKLKIKPTDSDGTGKVVNFAKDLAKIYLRSGENFIWNATNTSKQIREGLISLFSDYNAKIDIHFLYKDFSEIVKQNRNRDDVVPLKILEKLYRNLEYPMNRDCFELKIIQNE